MKKIFPLFASILLLLSACGNATKDEQHTEEHTAEHTDQHLENDSTTSHNHLSGDLQEVTDSVKQLPSFLNSQPEDIRLVYEVAGQATDILKWIPCYCGCGESAGHRNNLNCFIAEKRDDGSVVWDDHGTRCQVCLEIAVASVQMYQQGKSLKEIRNAIDATYEQGYATPTSTDMPA